MGQRPVPDAFHGIIRPVLDPEVGGARRYPLSSRYLSAHSFTPSPFSASNCRSASAQAGTVITLLIRMVVSLVRRPPWEGGGGGPSPRRPCPGTATVSPNSKTARRPTERRMRRCIIYAGLSSSVSLSLAPSASSKAASSDSPPSRIRLRRSRSRIPPSAPRRRSRLRCRSDS